MTRISIDPGELTAVAATVRSSAVEAADIGAALSSCTCCAMPPETEAVVTQLVSVLDRTLDELARRLNVAADDLVGRAGLASQDSLTTAAAASAPVVGGSLIGGGGSWYPEPTVSNAGLSGSGLVGGVGGWSTPTTTSGTLGGPLVGGGFGTFSIQRDPSVDPLAGFTHLVGGGMGGDDPTLRIAGLVEDRNQAARAAIRNGVAAGPGSSLAGPSIGLDVLDSSNQGIRNLTTPSRRDVENRLGRPVSVGEYHSMGFRGFTGRVG